LGAQVKAIGFWKIFEEGWRPLNALEGALATSYNKPTPLPSGDVKAQKQSGSLVPSFAKLETRLA